MSRNFKHFSCFLLVLCLVGLCSASAYGQERPPKLPKEPKSKIHTPPPGIGTPGFFDGHRMTSEKSMVVDGDVAIKLCVAQGDLRINGWRRDEVRVFVKNGRKFRLKPQEKSAQTGKVNWLWISNVVEGHSGSSSECLAGDTIEIDAPVGASLDLSGREVRTSVDSLRKINVNILSGAVTIRNISGGISAQTGRGDMIVENSAGAIELSGLGAGNIIVADVKSGQIGDRLKIKTSSGAISMQRVEHRQIQANSISGSMLFDGKFLAGGIYAFRTSNGSIELAIPASSSCTFKAVYGVGRFRYDVPLKIITENITPRAKTVVATMGSGAANVSLETSTGTIGIRTAVTAL